MCIYLKPWIMSLIMLVILVCIYFKACKKLKFLLRKSQMENYLL